jgi:vacuolar-type H+-ATPase subunit E/Vma4
LFVYKVEQAQLKGELDEMRWKAKAEAEEFRRKALEDVQASQDLSRQRMNKEEAAELEKHEARLQAAKDRKVREGLAVLVQCKRMVLSSADCDGDG